MLVHAVTACEHDFRGGIDRLDVLMRFFAAHAGHDHVENDDIDFGMVLVDLDSFVAARGCQHFVAILLQQALYEP
ncbi:MAG: hypothetical protein U5O39_01805 [Gammaproteobacteria bacterium]|nr:hypothetical protein [Gammaproteobacteria bacterium]